MNSTEDASAQVRLAQLDLLAELKRICDKNSISYCLVYGSLLGAVRHNGFIPWDDDVDVGMLRSEYERFIKVCSDDLDKDYALYDWNIDKASPLPFLKLKIRGTHYCEEMAKQAGINDEIFIDIFPFDNAPDNYVTQKIQSAKIWLFKKILLLRCGYNLDSDNIIKRVIYSLIKATSMLRSIDHWKTACHREMIKYNTKDTRNVISLGGAYPYGKELKENSIIKETILHDFEDLKLSIPRQYNRYLSEIYGDYMQLPPISQQSGRHDVIKTDLGSYTVRSNHHREE